jgi:hypothetical protein
MGHSEMLLAVAGLDKDSLDERARMLASGNWSAFPAGDRAAFLLARKQAETPWAVTTDDIEILIDHFGQERALDVIWWMCRCHYMTRVADGFQLPLERENVFQAPKPVSTPAGARKP